MNIEALLQYRDELLANATSEDGFLSESNVLDAILPELLDCKLIDSEDVNHSFFFEESIGKVNAYTFNESGERLQLFVLNSNAIRLGAGKNDLLLSRKSDYEKLFSLGTGFIKKGLKGYLGDYLQDSSVVNLLYSQLRSPEILNQIDVIEIILISPSITIETRGLEPSLKRIEFEDAEIDVRFAQGRNSTSKKITILRNLVDLNYLYDVQVSKSGAYNLKVDFENYFEGKVEVLKAADEENFESFLCVLPAAGMARLYKRESSRLLEKNVRSFLQFRGVNKGMKETIRKSPEKFIAFNNGLTITAIDKEIEEIGERIFLKSLTDFQIVNGGQTTASIFFASKEGLDISKINLMAKINVVKNVSEEELDLLISDISLYSNSQSKVSRVDLKSRNLELEKIKTLSKSVLAPNGNKWFFEKSRGEFNTMVKLSGGNKKKLEKSYPRSRRFSKEQLGKYYTSWGETPHLVKLGGEKVFRYFIEQISGDGDKKKPLMVDRDFFEELISRIIIFRTLEKMHGAGKNAIGQLRSAVVPYTMSVLHMIFNQKRSDFEFNLEKVWKDQCLDEALELYLYELMKLINELIKKYAKSDDFGQYSKREELWRDIQSSKEISAWIAGSDTKSIIKLYSRKKIKKPKKNDALIVDFNALIIAAELFSLGRIFYSQLELRYEQFLSAAERRRIQMIKANFFPRTGPVKEVAYEDLKIVHSAISRIRVEYPSHFDSITQSDDSSTLSAVDQVIKIFNACIENEKNIQSEFDKHHSIAKAKSYNYAGVISKIGKKLANGEVPIFSEVSLAAPYFEARETKMLSLRKID